ncbi:MAG: alpha/beta hydrolase [Candidatus Eremiobacteraeota bacterium]|nr:alpha/beta hydrolase [Candidatus Eremiobacteraeota bacterium]MBV8459346.1 alpha/beta hydrolase [Candidatus Eremiobacteraeota bacterium]
MDVPTLFIHGDDDQIAPYQDASVRAVKLVPDGRLEIYKGAPHGLPSTLKDRLNAYLLAFFGAAVAAREPALN